MVGKLMTASWPPWRRRRGGRCGYGWPMALPGVRLCPYKRSNGRRVCRDGPSGGLVGPASGRRGRAGGTCAICWRGWYARSGS